MENTQTEIDTSGDDEAFENAPLQFAADRIAKLAKMAEVDPNQRVTVSSSTMHKLYVSFLGLLEVYREQTATGTLINGERFLCSEALRVAIAPIMDEHRRIQAEKDIDREIELSKVEALAAEGVKKSGLH
jgi:hypothetical protein